MHVKLYKRTNYIFRFKIIHLILLFVLLDWFNINFKTINYNVSYYYNVNIFKLRSKM